MGLLLTSSKLATPDDLYFRGIFPAFAFRPRSFEQEHRTRSFGINYRFVCLLQAWSHQIFQSTPNFRHPPSIWTLKLKLFNWFLTVASYCKESVGIRPLSIVLELLTTTGILVAPLIHIS